MPSPSLTPDQLTHVRQNTNWRQLFDALHIAKDSKKSKDHDWWGKSPFRPHEVTPSFHMNARGWYCHSTSQGRGPIELVQGVHTGMNCYAAGRWLLERGISRIVSSTRTEFSDNAAEPNDAAQTQPNNPPIRQNLLPSLIHKHEALDERGLSPKVLYDLDAGYLKRPPRKDGRHDPMNERIVFQIRRLADDPNARPASYVVGHIGRATTEEQAERDGKWWTYPGFRKSLEVFNLDHFSFDKIAEQQALLSGHILVVEGCFDVTKLYAAGIRNVVAIFGSRLSEQQLELLQRLAKKLGVKRFRLFFDRDEAGEQGAKAAVDMISRADTDLTADVFDWNPTWTSDERTEVPIPDSISDPADFSPGQLLWLRQEGLL